MNLLDLPVAIVITRIAKNCAYFGDLHFSLKTYFKHSKIDLFSFALLLTLLGICFSQMFHATFWESNFSDRWVGAFKLYIVTLEIEKSVENEKLFAAAGMFSKRSKGGFPELCMSHIWILIVSLSLCHILVTSIFQSFTLHVYSKSIVYCCFWYLHNLPWNLKQISDF